MSEPDLPNARTAYDSVAALYADQFRDTLDDRPVERGLLAAFAENVRRAPAGPVVRSRLGPGHIAAHLYGLGLPVLGVDQSAEMLAVGSARYSGVSFALGSITRLGMADNSCGGVLSRSLGHSSAPAISPSALTEFARVLVPGGWLLLSFSATDGPEPPYEYYDHRVAQPTVGRLITSRRIAAAGVTETARLVESPEPESVKLNGTSS